MRILILLGLLALAVPVSAQTVESITFGSRQSMDGLYVDSSGDLFAVEGFVGDEVYAITPGGDLSTFASGIDGPIHLTEAPDGGYFVTDFKALSPTRGEVSRISPSGEVSFFAAVRGGPSDIVIDDEGNLFVSQFGEVSSDENNGNGNSITKITPDGTVTDFAVGDLLATPVGLDFDDEGALYAANIFDGRIVKIAPDGTQSLFASLPRSDPFTIGHLVWANGHLYATYLGGHQVWEFDPDGTGRVVAGSGARGRTDGPAASATFNQPNGIAASITGDTLFVSEYIGPVDRIRMIVLNPTVDAEEVGSTSVLGLQFESTYPNPFDDAATVRFALGTSAEVTLDVYDVLGRRIDRVEIGRPGSGSHAAEWRPTTLPSGVYVLRLRAGSEQAARLIAYQP